MPRGKTQVTISAIRRWIRSVDKGRIRKSDITRIMNLLEGRRKIANNRLAALSKSGYLEAGIFGSQAGKTALAYARSISGRKTGKSFFKQKTLMDALQQGLYIERFLQSEQSTIKGTKKRMEIVMDNYRNKFPSLMDWKDKDLKEFIDFMNSSSMNDFLSFFAKYREAVEMLSTIFEEESGKQFLNDAFDQLSYFLEQEKKEDYWSIEGGLTVREARDLIQSRYKSILERRRR